MHTTLHTKILTMVPLSVASDSKALVSDTSDEKHQNHLNSKGGLQDSNLQFANLKVEKSLIECPPILQQQNHLLTQEELIEDYINKYPGLKYELKTDDVQYLQNKSVLITGAGGTIGMEMVRQLINYQVKNLILIDNNENGIQKLRVELEDKCKSSGFQVIFYLVDVCDAIRLNSIFRKWSPNVIFHFANYKSLEMGNRAQGEFVRVNIGGTNTLLQISSSHLSTEKFIYISSDKAQDPSQTYGRTKRFNEQLVSMYAHHYPRIKFGSMRYCNVLDAAGSFAIPKFVDQLANGRKITIRLIDAKEVPTRYFMPRRTAARLAIKIGSLCNTGEIYSLDKRELKPIRIDSLVAMIAKKIFIENVEQWLAQNVVFVSGERGEKKAEELGIGTSVADTPMIMICPPQMDQVRITILKNTFGILMDVCHDIDYDLNVEMILEKVILLLDLAKPFSVEESEKLFHSLTKISTNFPSSKREISYSLNEIVSSTSSQTKSKQNEADLKKLDFNGSTFNSSSSCSNSAAIGNLLKQLGLFSTASSIVQNNIISVIQECLV